MSEAIAFIKRNAGLVRVLGAAIWLALFLAAVVFWGASRLLSKVERFIERRGRK